PEAGKSSKEPRLGSVEMLERYAKIFAAIGLPIVIAVLGNLFTQQQRVAEQHEHERQQLLQISTFLLDDNPRKKIFAGGIMEMMQNEGSRIPQTLLNLAVAAYNANDTYEPSSTGASGGQNATPPAALPTKQAELAAATSTVLGGLAPRLFIHIAEPEQRADAE